MPNSDPRIGHPRLHLHYRKTSIASKVTLLCHLFAPAQLVHRPLAEAPNACFLIDTNQLIPDRGQQVGVHQRRPPAPSPAHYGSLGYCSTQCCVGVILPGSKGPTTNCLTDMSHRASGWSLLARPAPPPVPAPLSSLTWCPVLPHLVRCPLSPGALSSLTWCPVLSHLVPCPPSPGALSSLTWCPVLSHLVPCPPSPGALLAKAASASSTASFPSHSRPPASASSASASMHAGLRESLAVA